MDQACRFLGAKHPGVSAIAGTSRATGLPRRVITISSPARIQRNSTV
jgi:hypothetical protein